MKIVVDNREHSLIKLLKALNNDYEYNIPIVVEKMDLGDIAIHFDDEEIILMERKKLSDLASSIRDGRYKEQSYRLNGNSLHNHNIMYIVEVNLARLSLRLYMCPCFAFSILKGSRCSEQWTLQKLLNIFCELQISYGEKRKNMDFTILNLLKSLNPILTLSKKLKKTI